VRTAPADRDERAGTTLTSRAALIHFREQGAGVLINTSSLLGVVPNPVVPTYSMSKFAVRGLTLSLDQAARGDPSIKVCVVLPGALDAPMFDTAVNRSGPPLRAVPPAISAERAAAAVLRSVRRPRRQRTTGLTGALIVIGLHVVPRLTETVVAQIARRLIFRDNPLWPRPHVPPGSEGAVSGGWRRSRIRTHAGDAAGGLLARGVVRRRDVPVHRAPLRGVAVRGGA
jgi:NAD(P)-dependent dehydrogenase (short-subunit alcohol dehydrogenase family)